MVVIGIEELFTELGLKFRCKLNYQLANSSEWKTRIIWPEKLKDKELYEIIGVETKTFWKK